MSGVAFEQEPSGLGMHRAPRFGHTSDMSKLASANIEEKNDYIHGVISCSVFVLCIFVVWAIILTILKFLGRKKVGCAAGRVVQRDSTTQSRIRAKKVQDRVQILFLLCACATFLASGLLISRALPSVQEAVTDMSKLNEDAQTLIYEGMVISDAASRAQEEIRKVDMEMINGTDSFCPNADEVIVLELNAKFKGTLEEISRTLEKLDEYMTSDADEVNENLDSILEATLSYDEAIAWVQDNDWMATMFVLLLSVLTFFSVLGVCLAHSRKSTPPVRCFMAYVITPVFAAVIVGGWIVASGSTAVAIMNADFCKSAGSPEETVAEVLRERGIKEGDTLWEAFTYYRSGCLVGDNPADFMKDYESEVASGLESTSAFETYVSEHGIELVNHVCGADITPVLDNVKQLSIVLNTALGGLRKTQDFASCRRISPLYRRIFRGSTCGESVHGLSSLFSCFLAICFCGMTMLSLRSAMYMPAILEEVRNDATHSTTEKMDDEWEDYKAYMSRYYETKSWRKQSPSANSDGIEAVATFETESYGQSWDESEEYAVCDGSPGPGSPTVEEFKPLSPPASENTSGQRYDMASFLSAQSSIMSILSRAGEF